MTTHHPTRRDPALLAAAAAAIAVGALSFWLSFTALADLARQSGFHGPQAYAWPLIVDGIVVVATVGALRLHTRTLPWCVLIAAAMISLAGNGLHAWRLTDSPVAVAVAIVPPMAVVVATILTERLFRGSADTIQKADQGKHPQIDVETITSQTGAPVTEETAHAEPVDPIDDEKVTLALKLAAEGLPNREIGDRVGKSEATIRRWRKHAA